MERIYKEAVVEFENTDDAYQGEIGQCYGDYAAFMDYGCDNAVSAIDFGRGAWSQIAGAIELACTIQVTTIPTLYLYYTGKLNAKWEQRIGGMLMGMGLVLKNPNLSDMDKTLLQEGLDKANSYISRIEDLFKPYGGIK